MKTIVDYATFIKGKHALNKTIAPVETNLAGASQAYAIGQQFIYNGVLYKAKTAIAQGDPLVLDTNYEAADDLAEQIADANGNIANVQTALADEAAARSALGAKNLLRFPYTTTSYSILTINDDGSLTLDGTPTSDFWVAICNNGANADPFILPAGKYIFSCARDSASVSMTLGIRKVSDDSSLVSMYFSSENYVEAEFELSEPTNLKVRGFISANTTVNGTLYPMIRLADDADKTWQPFAKTNQQLTEISSDLVTGLANEAATRSAMGAKNMIPYPYYNGDSRDTNGILFTVNSDGSVTISGEATADAYFRLTYTTGDIHIPLVSGKSYILSATGKADVALLLRDDGSSNVAVARGADATYDCETSGNYDAIILVENGANYTTPITVYPMLRLATDSNSDYQPYAKTNKELTNEVSSLNTAIANEVETRAKLGAHNFYSGGDIAKTSTSEQFYEQAVIPIKAGDYNISALVTSSNTTSNAVRVSFRNKSKGNIQVINLVANSGVRTNENFTLSEDCYYIYFYGADTTAEATATSTLTDILIKLSTDAYTEYTPYAPTNAECLSVDANVELGAHQLFNIYDLDYQKSKNTAGTWSSNVYTQSGGTWTVNSDLSVTAGGTPTSGSSIALYGTLPARTVKFRTPSAGTNTLLGNFILYDSSNSVVVNMDLATYGNDAEIALDLSSYTFSYVRLDIKRKDNNVAMSGTYNPLFTIPSDPSTAYTPCAMTNRELTKKAVLYPDYPTRTQILQTTSAQATASTTALKDGFVLFRLGCLTVPSSSSGVGMYGKINNATAANATYTHGNEAQPLYFNQGPFPVKTGDTIEVSTTDATNFEARAFFIDLR